VHNALNRLYLVVLAKGSRDVAQTEHSAPGATWIQSSHYCGHGAVARARAEWRLVKNDPRVELSSRLRETSVADAHPDVEGSEMIHHPPKAARYANHSRHSVTEQRTEDTRSAVRCAGIPQGREIASRATWARASLDKLARALPREFRLTRDRRRVAERSEKRERERERDSPQDRARGG